MRYRKPGVERERERERAAATCCAVSYGNKGNPAVHAKGPLPSSPRMISAARRGAREEK